MKHIIESYRLLYSQVKLECVRMCTLEKESGALVAAAALQGWKDLTLARKLIVH